ncbi:MAG: hypothetical protein KAS73_04450, partial [Candidatus Sabulitectum sp.]|nr:hypothetical protein [Candidatus Sabulitectum sp.]
MNKLILILQCILISVSCSAEVPLENLSFPVEEAMEESFARFYTPVEYTSAPGMEELSLPLATEDIINLLPVLLLAGLTNAPDILVESGFAVVPMGNPTDDPVRAFESLDRRDQPIFVSSGIPLH